MKKTKQTAGRKGGKATLRKYGPDHYAKIGRKGGKKSGVSRRKP